ncbi:MAG: DUF1800 domain-containing protein [Saprospiraceae bacterium]
MPNYNYARREFLKKLSGMVDLPVEPIHSDIPASQFPEMATITLNGDLTPYNGPWGFDQAAHLLRRTTFGVRKGDVDQLVALGSADAAVDFILDVPVDAPAPPINNYNNPDFTDPDVPSGQTWVNALPDFTGQAEGFRIESWRGWWLQHMVESEPHIREKMTLFWHNHFATQTSEVFIGRLAYQNNALLRSMALGNFKALVRAVTLDPMMLVYLNGYLNHKDAPDENYSRELQELFTVGKDTLDHYTEDDVVAAARVLTGWRINPSTADVFLDFTAHDTSNKQFSSFYNNTVITGSINGDAELDALLDMIFNTNEVAAYICRKIYRYFIYYKIDQTVEDDIIQPLAQVFRDNNYDIKPVLETLFKSEHFFDAMNTGCYIKNPIDLMAGVLRNFNQNIETSTLLDSFLMPLYLNYTANSMQMLPGDPPNVAGWSAYRQLPVYYRIWVTADTIRNRNIFSDTMTLYYYETPNDRLNVDSVAMAEQFDSPDDPNMLLDDILRLLLPQEISLAKKTLLKSILLSGQTNDFYWTLAWNNYVNNPGDQMAYETVRFRLALLHKYIMNLPEYQLA